MKMPCPYCGARASAARPIEEVFSYYAGTTFGTILRLLAQGGNHTVWALAAHVYAGAEAPGNPDTVIRVLVHRYRTDLQSFGYEIITEKGKGYALIRKDARILS